MGAYEKYREEMGPKGILGGSKYDAIKLKKSGKKVN